MNNPGRQVTKTDADQAVAGVRSSLKAVESLQKVLTCLRGFFAPALGKRSGQKRNSTCAAIAKKYGASALQLVKNALAALSEESQTEHQAVLGQLAALGLDVLAVIRSSLKGRRFEVELQRYSLVRQLIARGLHAAALGQSWFLYDSICQLCSPDIVSHDSDQPPTLTLSPPDSTHLDQCGVSLIVGTVLCLVVCSIEAPVSLAVQQLHRLLVPLLQAVPWIRWVA